MQVIRPKEVLFYYVEHHLELTEKQNTVLVDDWCLNCLRTTDTDSTVIQQLPGNIHNRQYGNQSKLNGLWSSLAIHILLWKPE